MFTKKPNKAYAFTCDRSILSKGEFIIAWTVNRPYSLPKYRLYDPVRYKKWVREEAARRFCKKHGIDFPPEEEEDTDG